MIQTREIAAELEDVRTIGIAGHIRPDGDCVGACISLYLYLTQNYPQIEEVSIYLGEIPQSFEILPCMDKIQHSCEEDKEFDLFIAVDCADKKRLGDAVKYFDSAKKTVCYDHHVSNEGYGDVNFIDGDISSTCELLYHVMDYDKITKEIAEVLYVGIINDTGVFQYSCTSPETMEVAANLMRKGINFSEIVDKTFYEKTYLQNQILGKALLESLLVLDGKCIISVIKLKDLDFFEVGYSDLEGIVSQLRLTKGVEVAIFLYELGNQEYKVSLRSKNIVDCSVVAKYFGGGGHIRAAGCEMQGSFHDVVNNLTAHIEKQMLDAEAAALQS
ncbi:MAG: bifunctional oligoribonuclease/PAP phosphatase NrnA [Eubacteriales bacterium]|nr:bifunctional oligoribonuclease/PAP phosphatase NrnA [Eubacteriales bacterium]